MSALIGNFGCFF